MNEAGPWGKGAREGKGRVGKCRRQGRVREVMGVLQRWWGSEKAAGGESETESRWLVEAEVEVEAFFNIPPSASRAG